MYKREMRLKNAVQKIDFWTVLGKHYVFLRDFAAITASLAQVPRIVAFLVVLCMGLPAPGAYAAAFTSSSARKAPQADDLYIEDEKFGTAKSAGDAFDTAPDGSRIFKTVKKPEKKEDDYGSRYDIKIRPEINIGMPVNGP